MTEIAAQTIGRRHAVQFKVAQLDVVSAKVDLLVVGMFEQDGVNTLGGGASQLDLALHGTLGRLREGGIFKGTEGETLMLSTPPPPIEARSLLLIGMGDGVTAPCTAVGHPTEIAMRTALRMEVRSVGCLLAWLDRAIPADMVEASAVSMMEGALRAIEERADCATINALDWIFDIRNGDAARTTEALTRALSAKPNTSSL